MALDFVADRYQVTAAGGSNPLLIAGTADPSAGAGVAAPEGSLYMRNNAGAGEVWQKTGAADTAWALMGGGGNTLDQAYDQGGPGAGRTIVVDSGAVVLDADTADTSYALEITREPAGAAIGARGVRVVMGANSTGPGVYIERNGTGYAAQISGGAIKIDHTGPAIQFDTFNYFSFNVNSVSFLTNSTRSGQVALGGHVIVQQEGAVATPAIYFGVGGSLDPNTGPWHPGADTMAISTGGVEAVRWNSSQQTLLPSGSPATPVLAPSATPGNGLYFDGGASPVFAIAGIPKLYILSGFNQSRNPMRFWHTTGDPTAPALTDRTDTNTGPYWGGADDFYIATAGVQAVEIDASQNVTIAGDIDAAGGFRHNFNGVLQTAAGPADYPLGVNSNRAFTAGNEGYIICLRAGSVVGIGAVMDDAINAGTHEIWVQKSTDGGATWSDLWGTSVTGALSLSSGIPNSRNAWNTDAKDTHLFNAGDIIRVLGIGAMTDGSGSAIYSHVNLEMEW